MKLLWTFGLLCVLSQNNVYSNNINYNTSAECRNQNQPLNENDTLCGEKNNTLLKCLAERVCIPCPRGQLNCPDGGHWTSVCLFRPSENHQEFFYNYTTYHCKVIGDFGPANCSLKSNPSVSFVAECNYTFYICKQRSTKCYDNFENQLKGTGLKTNAHCKYFRSSMNIRSHHECLSQGPRQ